MSGGGRTVKSGRMGQSAVATVSPEEIKHLETNLADMETRLQQMQQRRNDLKQQISSLEPELRQMTITYQQCSNELKVNYFIS